MKVLGLAGWSGSGKTTLMLSLITALTRRGLRVSSLKHSHHRVEVDQPEDDSRRLRHAGATEVLVAGSRRFVLFRDESDHTVLTLEELLPHFTACDLLLVEGFKRGRHAKLEVFRPELGKPPLYPEDPQVVAIATTAAGPFPVPRYDLGNTEAIADFVMGWAVSANGTPGSAPDQ